MRKKTISKDRVHVNESMWDGDKEDDLQKLKAGCCNFVLLIHMYL